MDPIRNPFAPGAGTEPPELAGRAAVIESTRIALGRVRIGRSAKSQMFLGLRGVGKTVLLNHAGELARRAGYETVTLEAPENRRLAEMLIPPLRGLLRAWSTREKAKAAAFRALGALRAFASAFKVKVGDVEFGVEPAIGTADSGDLQFDLPDLLSVLGDAASASGAPVAILVDEIQYLSSDELGAVIVAMHRMAQKGLPVILFGAGLPQMASLAGEAKSYSERLFDYPEIGKLDDPSARAAIREPLRREGVEITDEALALLLRETEGYPYFLQEWGARAWDAAKDSPIGVREVRLASATAMDRLDQGFFKVRLDRLSDREQEYLLAMAERGAGPHRSGEIADQLGVDVRSVAPIRSSLIRKGMIFSPRYGLTAFTVPKFDEFMRRRRLPS